MIRAGLFLPEGGAVSDRALCTRVRVRTPPAEHIARQLSRSMVRSISALTVIWSATRMLRS